MVNEPWVIYKEEIREKADFLGLVQQKVALPRSPNGNGPVMVLCPWHPDQKTPSLAVYTDHATCYGACSQTWDVFGWGMKLWGVDFAGARDRLAEMYHVPKPEISPEAQLRAEDQRKEEELLRLAADHYQQRLWNKKAQTVLTYARGRGWDDEIIKAMGLGASGGLGAHLGDISADIELAKRLGLLNERGLDFIQPGFLVYIHQRAGRVGYISARSIESKQHLNLPGHKHPYFNSLYSSTIPTVLLVEGQADAISAAYLGVPAVALAGCSLSDDLLERLQRHHQIVVCLDSDETGQKASSPVCEALGPLTQVLAIAEGNDLNDWHRAGLTADKLQEAILEAPTWLDLRIANHKAMNGLQRDRDLANLFSLLARLDEWILPRYRQTVCANLKMPASDFNRYLQMTESGEMDEDDLLPEIHYTIKDGCLCYWQPSGGLQPLCNFVAEVTEEIVEDDGQDTRRKMTVEGTLKDGRKLPTATVPAEKFGAMGWVLEEWGISANIYAGVRVRDNVRSAIQQLSHGVANRWVYTHTGWREIEDTWCYLSHGSAIGKKNVEVDLGARELQLYSLPAEPVNLIEAVKWSLDFLEAGPYHVTIPIWAAMYLAPLSSIKEPDFILWLYGTTGSLKSSLASLALAHYGSSFAYNRMPANWEDTENKLEKKAFQIKDAPLLIDDFAPQATISGAGNLEQKASRVLRNLANRSGRGRLRSDLSDRTTYNPRGLVMATGEKLPTGHSIIGRLFAIQMEPNMISLEKDILPRAAIQHHYSQAMSGYISWLASRYQNLAETIPERFLHKMHSIPTQASHLRVNSAVACLYIGLEMGLDFALEVKAIEKAKAQELQELGWYVMLDAGQEQSRLVLEEKPVERFIAVLKTLLAQGHYYLADKDGIRPDEHKPGVTLLGWEDADLLYLMGEAAHNAVAIFCRAGGEYFSPNLKQLYKMLEEEGLLIPGPEKKTQVVKIAGTPERVAVLIKKRVFDNEEIYHEKESL